jgi:hypothetical protein
MISFTIINHCQKTQKFCKNVRMKWMKKNFSRSHQPYKKNLKSNHEK